MIEKSINNTLVLANQNFIKKEKLDKNQYIFSLLNAGFTKGIFDRTAIENIKMQIILILKELIIRYTKGESTSVTVETAEKILNSICYSMDAYALSINSFNECIAVIKEKSVKEIYEKGVEIVAACVKKTKLLYSEVLQNKLDIPLIAYNDTLNDGIVDFFDKYEVVFNAHDTMASIDYPLLFDDMNIRGVFYVKQYLEKVNLENQFCKLFRKEDIIEVLNSYGKIYRIEYTEALINIFEIVINNSIFSAVLGRNVKSIKITKFQQGILIERFQKIKSCDLNSVVEAAVNEIINELQIDNFELIEYIFKYIDKLIKNIQNAIENKSLDKLIILDACESLSNNAVVFEDGERINDDNFRLLVKKIIKCRDTEKKIEMVKDNIHSLQDLIDILSADCLFDNEFISLFNNLSDIELSVIGKDVFHEELRSDSFKISNISSKDKEFEWQIQFVEFINNLSRERRVELQDLISEL